MIASCIVGAYSSRLQQLCSLLVVTKLPLLFFFCREAYLMATTPPTGQMTPAEDDNMGHHVLVDRATPDEQNVATQEAFGSPVNVIVLSLVCFY